MNQIRFLYLPLLLLSCYLLAQNSNTYLGPNQKEAGTVRLQILVNDDPSPQGVQIIDASFNGMGIPLKPRDVNGFRGQASFQPRPGAYKLVWKVKRDSSAWPRTTTHEEDVTLDPHDLWIQITITGENASIS